MAVHARAAYPSTTCSTRNADAAAGDVVPAIVETLTRFIRSPTEYLETEIVYAHWLWTGGAAALGLRRRFGWPVRGDRARQRDERVAGVHPFCRPYVERVLSDVDLPLANCEFSPGPKPNACPRRATGSASRTTGAMRRRSVQPNRGVRCARRCRSRPHLSYFVCCATVLERKGIAELAQAWRQFAPRRRTWRLVVVGPIVSRGLAREAARPRAQSR
jgi:hypothetical protein